MTADDQMAEIRHHMWLMGHLLVAFAGVVGAVLDADRALIPDNVWEAAEQAKAQLDEHAL